MKYSVIIPTFGRPDDLERCLDSLERLTIRPQETLIVTAESDVATEAVAARFSQVLGARIVRANSRGAQVQRNRGIEHISSTTDVVLFLDDDVVLEEDYVERLAEVLLTDPEVGGVAGVAIEPQLSRPLWLRTWRRLFLGQTTSRPVLTRAGINLPAEGGIAPVEADWLFGCAAYRREIVDGLRFDEALDGHALMDDVEFSLRVARTHRLMVVPAARLDHRRSAVNRISADDFGYQFMRNRWWVICRHRPGLRSKVAFWWTSTGHAVFWALSATRGDPLAAARLRGMARGALAVVRGDLPSARECAGTPPTIAVVIPTVAGREESLDRCMAAVRSQTSPADEVCVVRGCASYVSAIREGFARTSSDWIAFLDDDAIPQSDWLESLSRHLADPDVGAVGGRILNFSGGLTSAGNYSDGPVARITWYGRTLSRLHDIPLIHVVEDVDFLPGANMCFRRAALPPVDDRLDQGMAPGFEMALCLAVRRGGWRVVFDSDALVTHYPAPRPAHLVRGDRNRTSYEYSYMVTYALLRNLTWPRKLAFLAYFMLIGQRASPGLVFGPYFLLPGRSRSRFWAAWAGKLRGLRAALA